MGQKKSLRVLTIPFPPENTYSVPDDALGLRDPCPDMERGIYCAVGKSKSSHVDGSCL